MRDPTTHHHHHQQASRLGATAADATCTMMKMVNPTQRVATREARLAPLVGRRVGKGKELGGLLKNVVTFWFLGC